MLDRVAYQISYMKRNYAQVFQGALIIINGIIRTPLEWQWRNTKKIAEG